MRNTRCLKVAMIGKYPEKSPGEEVFTGVMSVVYGLVKELRRYPEIEVQISIKDNKFRASERFMYHLSSFMTLARSNAEIFHIHGVSLPKFISLIISKIKRGKTIYTAHGLVSRERKLGYYYPLISLFYEFCLIKLSDHITTPSERMRNMIIRDYGVSIKKISVIKHGVDPSFMDGKILSARELKEKPYQLPEVKNKHIILYIGGTEKAKGLDFLLQSIDSLRKERKDFVLLVVGNKSDITNFTSSKYADLLAREYIKILGRLSHDKLNLLYDFIDILIVPSVHDSFGLVILEAMAKGKVVIVSNRVGASSIITNKKDGIIFSYGDISKLVYEIKTLLSNKQERDKIGMNAKETIKRYTWKKVAPKYLKCYAQILTRDAH